MKRVFLRLLVIGCAIVLAVILANPAITFLLKKQLKTVFKGSEVSIGSCRLNPAQQLSFFDVSIKNKTAYAFLVKEAKAEYSIRSIFKGEIPKVSLKDATIHCNLPQKNIAEFFQYSNYGSKSVFSVKSFEVLDSNFILQAKDFNANGAFSCRVNLVERAAEYLDITIDSLGIRGFTINGLALEAGQGVSEGHLGINQLKYNKLAIAETKSQAKLSGRELFLDGLSAQAFDGSIGGNVKLTIDRDIGCDAALKFMGLDIARFVHDFDLKEKFEMTGRLSGDLVFKSTGTEIEVLNGKISNLESGGTLIIKDTRFLENMARNSNQSLDLLVESFKDYHYTIGTIKLFLENNDLDLGIALSGETGKRDINVVLHDFRLKKEGI